MYGVRTHTSARQQRLPRAPTDEEVNPYHGERVGLCEPDARLLGLRRRPVAAKQQHRPTPTLRTQQQSAGRSGGNGTQPEMLSSKPESARCVQRFDDSLNPAIRTTYRISLRSSSLREPRHSLLGVVFGCVGVCEEWPVAVKHHATLRARTAAASSCQRPARTTQKSARDAGRRGATRGCECEMSRLSCLSLQGCLLLFALFPSKERIEPKKEPTHKRDQTRHKENQPNGQAR